jgi:hypothetical protein
MILIDEAICNVKVKLEFYDNDSGNNGQVVLALAYLTGVAGSFSVTWRHT